MRAMAGVGFSTLSLGWCVRQQHVLFKQVLKRLSFLKRHGTPMNHY